MKDQSSQWIYGRHPVLDALKSGAAIDKVFLQDSIRGELEKELRLLCRERAIPMRMIPKDRLTQMVRGNHQGVVALQALVTYYRLEDVLPTIYERSEMPLILLLEGVTDVRNLGAIARTAEVCGAHAIVVGQKNTALINAEAMKASAGALATLPVCRERSLLGAIEYLQQSGIRVLASSLRAEKPLHELDISQPCAFLLGAEGRGISLALSRAADENFIIPQRGQTDSLNVSVAAGMMLYEAMRQR